MLSIDLSGKRAFVAGVADDGGFGFAIAKALAAAGASVCVGTWPPALGIFETLLRRGKLDASLQMPDGSKLALERIYPLDAEYDTLADTPEELRQQKRYRDRGDFSIEGVANRLRQDFGEGCLDIVVHSLANGPEVTKPLMETSRKGYLAAVGASAYSFVSLAQRMQPLMRPIQAFRIRCSTVGVLMVRASVRRCSVSDLFGRQQRRVGNAREPLVGVDIEPLANVGLDVARALVGHRRQPSGQLLRSTQHVGVGHDFVGE